MIRAGVTPRPSHTGDRSWRRCATWSRSDDRPLLAHRRDICRDCHRRLGPRSGAAVKPVLYILGGIAGALGVAGLGMLMAWVATELLGPWGLLIEYLAMMALAGGWIGWLIYRLRRDKAKKPLVHRGLG